MKYKLQHCKSFFEALEYGGMKVEDQLWSSCYGEVWNFDHLSFTLLLSNNLSLSMRKGETSGA